MKSLDSDEVEALRIGCSPGPRPDAAWDDGDIVVCERLVERGLLVWQPSQEDDCDGWLQSVTTDLGRLALRLHQIERAEP